MELTVTATVLNYKQCVNYFETEILVQVFWRSSCIVRPWRPISIPQ